MARLSTWLLLAALVLAAACTANAQKRHLLQAPYNDIAAAAEILEVQQKVVTEALSASESLGDCRLQQCAVWEVVRGALQGRPVCDCNHVRYLYDHRTITFVGQTDLRALRCACLSCHAPVQPCVLRCACADHCCPSCHYSHLPI
jgi:hypothetical protein